MKFAPSSEQADFAASLRRLLDAADVPSVARAWAVGEAEPVRKLWARLAELGVTVLGRPDSGASAVDLVMAFVELGRAAVPGPYVESVAVLPALHPDADPELIGSLAMPPHVPCAVDGELADRLYLVQGTVLATARVSGGRDSVDPTRRLTEVVADAPIATVRVEPAFDRGALATAAYLQGTGQAMLDRSVAYAKQRSQFGKPIGSFQAVKHQLADVAVHLELARPLLFGAALALDGASPARDVSAAKVACTDAAYRAARVALQVHGAIGYTAEYDLALWLTKVRALASAWGTQRVHRDRVLAALR